MAVLDRRQCQSGLGWRLVTRENEAGYLSRTLWDVVQLAPSAQAALAKPFRLWAQDTLAIGYCTPGTTFATRAQRVLDVTLFRQLADGTVTPVTNTGIADAGLAQLGEVYLTPPRAMSPAGTWPAGDYLFHVQPHELETSGWFALEVRKPPL